MGLALILLFAFVAVFSIFAVDTFGFVTILVCIGLAPFLWAYRDARRSRSEFNLSVGQLMRVNLSDGNLWAGVAFAVIFAFVGREVGAR